MERLEDEDLTERIIACAFKVHRTLGSGFMEKVYESAMLIELHKAGLDALQQAPIAVCYEGNQVGEYYADLMVEQRIIYELKAAQAVAPEHELQLVNYLAATGVNTGLLFNIGKSVSVKRKFRNYHKPTSAPSPENPACTAVSC
jgi:GxxExxY protein